MCSNEQTKHSVCHLCSPEHFTLSTIFGCRLRPTLGMCSPLRKHIFFCNLWIHFWSAAENLQPSSEEWLTAALSSKIRSTQRLTTQSALLTWSQWWHRDVKLLMHPKASVMACANIIAVWSSWREMGSGQRSFTSCLTYVSIGATWCRSRGKEVNTTIRLFLI